MPQNRIWHIERQFFDARLSAVVVAPNRADALAVMGVTTDVTARGFIARCMGTAGKDIPLGVVVMSAQADDDEFVARVTPA